MGLETACHSAEIRHVLAVSLDHHRIARPGNDGDGPRSRTSGVGSGTVEPVREVRPLRSTQTIEIQDEIHLPDRGIPSNLQQAVGNDR